MNQTTERKPRETKPKIFGTFLIDDDGNEQLIAYFEHYSKPQAQAKALDDRIVTRLADHNDHPAQSKLGLRRASPSSGTRGTCRRIGYPTSST